MRTVDIGEAAGALSRYGSGERSETWVLTRRGKPVANSPEFIEIIERSRAGARAHGTIPIEDVEKELGIQPVKRRKPGPARRGRRSG